jgi:hypothetical protein
MRGTESLTNNNNIKKTVKNKALRGNPSQNPTRKARLRGAASVPSLHAMPSARRVTKTHTQAPCVACACVFVLDNFLYIHIYELTFNQAVVKNLGKINVESFGLYERN